jgi:prevent-host-death family protein
MAQIVNVSEAKARFIALLAGVESGEEVVIARAGRPIARLTPYVHRIKDRTPGAMKGRIWMSPGFDDTDEQFLQGFI